MRRAHLDCVLACFIGIAFLLADASTRGILWHGLFWDAHIYSAAFAKYAAGADPYGSVTNNSSFGRNLFVYPPVTLLAGNWIRQLIPETLRWFTYISLYVLSIALLLVVLVRHFARSEWMSVPLAIVLLVCAPDLAGADALLSGNLSMPCYAMVLAAAVPGIRRGRWSYFYAIVILIAAIKVSFLLLLMLPLLAGRRQLVASITCAGIVFSTYGAQWMFARTAFQQFLLSLRQQTYVGFDDGYSVFHYARVLNYNLHLGTPYTPFVAELVVTAIVFAALLYLRRMLADPPEGPWLAIILLAIVLLNPRMKVYDAAVGALPAFALLGYSLRTLPSLCAVIAVLLPTPFLVAACDFHAAEVLLWAAAFVGGYTALASLHAASHRQDQSDLVSLDPPAGDETGR